jgi:hypothetical protein
MELGLATILKVPKTFKFSLILKKTKVQKENIFN